MRYGEVLIAYVNNHYSNIYAKLTSRGIDMSLYLHLCMRESSFIRDCLDAFATR